MDSASAKIETMQEPLRAQNRLLESLQHVLVPKAIGPTL
jgi:hypothetical protein